MKKGVILAAILFVLVCMTPSWGQWRTQANVDVPYEFAVGDTVLPAGTYDVLTDNQQLPNTILILNEKTGASALANHNMILLTAPVQITDHAKLVFTSDGQHHQLHQVILKGDNHKHDLIHRAEIAELRQTSH